MRWLAGTSGYSYKEWRGSFYPDDIKPEDMLTYYAGQLPAVEINNTFYRMPRTHVLEGWAESVPEAFRFVIKATRRITHHARLANAEEPIGYLAKGVAVLEDKLGAVLFQLPPFLRKDRERLETFLDVWPKALPAAVEFRHDSWFDEEIFDLLRERKVAICVSDNGKLKLPAIIATTDWAYLRLRQPAYSSQKLGGWVRKATASSAKTTLAFFKHEDEAGGPALAHKVLELARRPLPKRAPRADRKAAPKRA